MRNTVLLLLLALIFTAASLNDARKANEAYENGDYAKAEQLYKKAIDQNPENAKLYFNLGNTLVNQEKTDEALRVFEQFKTMTDDTQMQALADYNIGNIYTQNKKWDKALNAYKEALRYRAADEDAKHNYELAKQKKKQQQKKQNQQNQQNNQDQNQKQNQQNQQDQQNQKQNQQQNQNQSQQNDSGDQQQKQQQQPRPNKISKAQAEKILQALEQKEKDLLKEFKKKKTESSNSDNDKDW